MKIRYTQRAMDERQAGYQEIEHTADWELRVWAPNLAILLETAAQGMYALSHTKLAPGPRQTSVFEIPFWDRESLLVDFLSELLFYAEDEGLAFDQFQLDFDGSTLRVQAHGAPLETQAKEIKAVTFHGMQIIQSKRGLEVCIVFDV